MQENTSAPNLFDIDARLCVFRKTRSNYSQSDTPFFLHHEIADRLQDRLLDINRTFGNKLDIGGDYFANTPAEVQKNETQARYSALLPAGMSNTHLPKEANIIPFDSETLPIAQNTYDLALSNLFLHMVNDLPGMLVQIKHSLKPDGLFIGSIFGGETLHELRHAFLAAESEITGGANARIIPFADVRDVGSLLQRAGFALPVTDMDTLTITYDHPLKLMHDLRKMGESNILQSRSRHFLRRDVLMRTCEIYMEKFSGPDGRIPATFQIIYMTGWHPHKSQQQPLKPGSGKVSLTKVLGKTPTDKENHNT